MEKLRCPIMIKVAAYSQDDISAQDLKSSGYSGAGIGAVTGSVLGAWVGNGITRKLTIPAALLGGALGTVQGYHSGRLGSMRRQNAAKVQEVRKQEGIAKRQAKKAKINNTVNKIKERFSKKS